MDNQLAISERVKSRETAIKEFIPMLRELVVNGQKLNDQQIMGRATFAAEEGLDPILEVHTMVDKDGKTMGHTMAINGYRRKCLEQVGPGGSIDLEFVELDKLKLPKGAFCGWECRLRDSQSYGLWQKRVLEIGKTLKEVMGAVSYVDLIAACGPAPITVGIGVVYESELNEWKDRAYNPIERCKKRAETSARHHRFPTNAPVYDDDGQSSGEVVNTFPVTVSAPPAPEPAKKPAAQILGELYGDLPKLTPTPDPLPEQQGQFTDAEPAAAEPAAWTSTKVSLEMAKSEKASDGTLYWEMATDQLAIRFNGIEATIKKNGLTPEKKESLLLKKDIVQAIMDYRVYEELT